MEELSKFPILISFIAGLLSFLSPCILPLVPAFISFIAGIEFEDLAKEQSSLKRIILKTAVFISGFSFVFIALGMSVSWLGGLLLENRQLLRYIGGAIVIIFGLHFIGVFRIKLLYRNIKIKHNKTSALNWFGIFFVGFAFALGWTPCVGPILATILVIASAGDSVSFGFWLLMLYSLGLAIPFLLTAVFINYFFKIFNKLKKYYRIIEIATGVLLIFTGILLITDGFTKITSFIMM